MFFGTVRFLAMLWERLNRAPHDQTQTRIHTSVRASLYLHLNLMRVSVKDLFKKRGVVVWLVGWLLAVLELDPKASHMLCKCFITTVYSQAPKKAVLPQRKETLSVNY